MFMLACVVISGLLDCEAPTTPPRHVGEVAPRMLLRTLDVGVEYRVGRSKKPRSGRVEVHGDASEQIQVVGIVHAVDRYAGAVVAHCGDARQQFDEVERVGLTESARGREVRLAASKLRLPSRYMRALFVCFTISTSRSSTESGVAACEPKHAISNKTGRGCASSVLLLLYVGDFFSGKDDGKSLQEPPTDARFCRG